MIPYYEKDGITIYNGDCLEVMKQFEDKSFDLVLTDPPYGIGEKYNDYNDTEDKLKELIVLFMPEFLRIGKIVAFTPGNKNIFFYPKPTWILSWVVPQGIGLSKWGFICWHAIMVYGKDPYLSNRMGSRPDIIQGNVSQKVKEHPCSKPLDIWEKLLKRCSVKSTDVILDPFMGSGTTLVAAKKLSRKAVGIEISEKYCEIAVKRIEAERKSQ